MNASKTLTLVPALALSLLAAGTAQASHGDRNRDGLPDRWERAHHLSLRLDQARRDQDHDGLDNRAEYRAGLNPHDRDSDDDGIADGRENAGSVASFAGGVLTIALAKGGTLTARVTDETRLECRGARASVLGDDHGGSGGHGGDDHGGHGGDDHGGGGEAEPGDDHGGGGEAEPGDDHGTHAEPGDDHGDHSTPPAASPAPAATPAPASAPAVAPNACLSALTRGHKVREAELRAAGGVATWKEIKL
jgi:hypothetical protein